MNFWYVSSTFVLLSLFACKPVGTRTSVSSVDMGQDGGKETQGETACDVDAPDYVECLQKEYGEKTCDSDEEGCEEAGESGANEKGSATGRGNEEETESEDMPECASEGEALDKPKELTVLAEAGINVRSAPRSSATREFGLDEGEQVKAYSVEKGGSYGPWYCIVSENGEEGWAASDGGSWLD